MSKEFTSLDDIKSTIEGMGFKIGDVWYDGNRSRPVFVCSREGLPHDIEVWAESPKYVNGVTIKDVSARDFDMVDGGEDVAGLKRAIKKALAYMGAKESKMKITVKEAKIYTADDFKAAAEEERFKNRAEIWADQFNRHAEYIGLKDRATTEKDIHGCDSVVWDYGYIVAKDPFGDKWQVRFGDNAYTMDKNKVTPYLYRQMDSMTGFKGEAYSDYKPLMDKVYNWYEKKNFWKEEDFWKDLEALYAHNYPNVGFKFVFKGDDECTEIYTKDGLLFTYSWKPVGRDRRHRSIAKDGSGYKHPGFNIKDDMHYMYDGITGKSLSDEWYEKVSESREYPVNLYITTRYDDADAVEQFLKELGGEDITVSKSRNGNGLYVSVEGDGVDAFLDVYRERFDDIVKSCDVDATGWTDPVDLKYYL